MYRLSEQLQPLNDLGVFIRVYEDSGSELRGFKEALLRELEGRTPLEPEDDGFLLSSDKSVRFLIRVDMPADKNLAAITILGGKDKQLSPLSNISTSGIYTGLKAVSTKFVNFDNGYSTMPDSNSFRIISTAGNVLTMFQVGIASRIYKEGSFHFLAVQELYRAQLFFDEKTRSVRVPPEEFPGYANWQSLKDMVSRRMVDPNNLPTQVSPSIPPAANVPNGDEARVLFFNATDGYGKALLKDGRAANLHWKQLDTDERFPYVPKGQLISFSAISTEKGQLRINGARLK